MTNPVKLESTPDLLHKLGKLHGEFTNCKYIEATGRAWLTNLTLQVCAFQVQSRLFGSTAKFSMLMVQM